MDNPVDTQKERFESFCEEHDINSADPAEEDLKHWVNIWFHLVGFAWASVYMAVVGVLLPERPILHVVVQGAGAYLGASSIVWIFLKTRRFSSFFRGHHTMNEAARNGVLLRFVNPQDWRSLAFAFCGVGWPLLEILWILDLADLRTLDFAGRVTAWAWTAFTYGALIAMLISLKWSRKHRAAELYILEKSISFSGRGSARPTDENHTIFDLLYPISLGFATWLLLPFIPLASLTSYQSPSEHDITNLAAMIPVYLVIAVLNESTTKSLSAILWSRNGKRLGLKPSA